MQVVDLSALAMLASITSFILHCFQLGETNGAGGTAGWIWWETTPPSRYSVTLTSTLLGNQYTTWLVANQVVYCLSISPGRWGWTRVGFPQQAFFEGWLLPAQSKSGVLCNPVPFDTVVQRWLLATDSDCIAVGFSFGYSSIRENMVRQFSIVNWMVTTMKITTTTNEAWLVQWGCQDETQQIQLTDSLWNQDETKDKDNFSRSAHYGRMAALLDTRTTN